MVVYKIKLVNKKEVASNTWLFEFTKPSEFKYRAGQCADFTIENPKYEDDRGNTRSFTIYSAPHEEYLSVIMRIRGSAFKRSLMEISSTDEVSLSGPYGSFTLHQQSTRPAVFLAGGVGVTPVLSIIRDSFYKKEIRKFLLFYSNRNLEDVVAFDELMNYAKLNMGFKFVPTLTAKPDNAWQYQVGRIDKAMLESNLDLKENAVYYISGSLSFVSANRELLLSLGISDDDIKTDEFPGY